ncbi:MAG TPA: DUF58 domain-containing protein [Acidimicrobiales bacterium]|nr:DUF58 domain-containing protein [Acidimicrobiales bacterium]
MIATSILVLFAWGAVAHQSGSGWVQAVGALVAGALLIGLGWPGIAARRIRVTCLSCEADGVAGGPLRLEVVSSAPARLKPTSPGGETVLAAAGDPTAVEVVPERRGSIGSVTLEAASAAPFGMLWWRQRLELKLPRQTLVSPRVGVSFPVPERRSAGDEGAVERAVSETGEIRSVRTYVHGDSPRRVHWPATAHAGTLMIRETEETEGGTVRITADLPSDPDEAERRAESVLATVVAVLGSGRNVRLDTYEPFEAGIAVVSGDVSSRLAAGRRLALAVPHTDDGRART